MTSRIAPSGALPRLTRIDCLALLTILIIALMLRAAEQSPAAGERDTTRAGGASAASLPERRDEPAAIRPPSDR